MNASQHVTYRMTARPDPSVRRSTRQPRPIEKSKSHHHDGTQRNLLPLSTLISGHVCGCPGSLTSNEYSFTDCICSKKHRSRQSQCSARILHPSKDCINRQQRARLQHYVETWHRATVTKDTNGGNAQE